MSSVYRKYQPNHLERLDLPEEREILTKRSDRQQSVYIPPPKKQEHSVIQYYGKKDLFTKSQQRNNCFPYISSRQTSTSQLSGQLKQESSQQSSSHDNFRMYKNISSQDIKKLGTSQSVQRETKPKIPPRTKSNNTQQTRSKSSNYRQLTSSRFENLQNSAIQFEYQSMENKFKDYFDKRGAELHKQGKVQKPVKTQVDFDKFNGSLTKNSEAKSPQERNFQLINAIDSDYYKINGKFVTKKTYLKVLKKLEDQLIEFQQKITYLKESELLAQQDEEKEANQADEQKDEVQPVADAKQAKEQNITEQQENQDKAKDKETQAAGE